MGFWKAPLGAAFDQAPMMGQQFVRASLGPWESQIILQLHHDQRLLSRPISDCQPLEKYLSAT